MKGNGKRQRITEGGDFFIGGKEWDIYDRSKAFALRIIRLYTALPKSTEAQVIGRQILRSGTSPGAQVREGKRSRSDAEMISKLQVALQELEETAYRLELPSKAGTVKESLLSELLQENNELIAILITSVQTIRKRNKNP